MSVTSVSLFMTFHPTYAQFKMVIKTVLDTLLLFVSFNESGGAEGGAGGRTGSPDSSGGSNTAQLLYEAVETNSEKKGQY